MPEKKPTPQEIIWRLRDAELARGQAASQLLHKCVLPAVCAIALLASSVSCGRRSSPSARTPGTNSANSEPLADSVERAEGTGPEMVSGTLAGCDLVVVGSVQKHEAMASGQFQLFIKVESVLQGRAAPRDVRVDWTLFYRNPPRRGTRVLAFANWWNPDQQGWRLAGNVLVVGDRGELTGSGFFGQDVTEPVAAPPGALDMVTRALSRRGRLGVVAQLMDASCVGLVRVRRIARDSDAVTLHCDSLAWILGARQRMPRFICYDWASSNGWPGTDDSTLLVPILAEATVDTVYLPGLPRPLRVSQGFCPIIGAQLRDFPRAKREIKLVGHSAGL